MTTLVEWQEMIAGKKIRRKGIPVGEYLIVASDKVGGKYFKIYRRDMGVPFINAIFEDKDSALTIANLIDNQYSPYFPIWQDYPNADIISLAKWSVKNGIPIYEMIREFSGKCVKRSELPSVWERAKSKARHWLRI